MLDEAKNSAEKTKIVRHKTSGEIDLFSAVNTEEKVNNLGILAVEKLDNLLLACLLVYSGGAKNSKLQPIIKPFINQSLSDLWSPSHFSLSAAAKEGNN